MTLAISLYALIKNKYAVSGCVFVEHPFDLTNSKDERKIRRDFIKMFLKLPNYSTFCMNLIY